MEVKTFKLADYYKPVELRKHLNNIEHRRIFMRQITVPSTETCAEILERIAYLNKAIKEPGCPIKKTPFYKIKHDFIEWCAMMDRFNRRIDIQVKVNGVEPGPETGCPLVALGVKIGSVDTVFHLPLKESVLKWVLYEDLNNRQIREYFHDEHVSTFDPTITKQHWESLLITIESRNWFIYDDMSYADWFDMIKKKYKGAKLTLPEQSFKMDLMKRGGPMVQSKGSDVCGLVEFREHFIYYINKLGHGNGMNKGYK